MWIVRFAFGSSVLSSFSRWSVRSCASLTLNDSSTEREFAEDLVSVSASSKVVKVYETELVTVKNFSYFLFFLFA